MMTHPLLPKLKTLKRWGMLLTLDHMPSGDSPRPRKTSNLKPGACSCHCEEDVVRRRRSNLLASLRGRRRKTATKQSRSGDSCGAGTPIRTRSGD